MVKVFFIIKLQLMSNRDAMLHYLWAVLGLNTSKAKALSINFDIYIERNHSVLVENQEYLSNNSDIYKKHFLCVLLARSLIN